jgi:single-strand DNA-binding protein
MSVNKVILVGFVGNDPEVKYLDNKTPVANFRLATTENYTNKAGEKVSSTEWHNIVLWRGLAGIAEKYVKKGTQLYIEGRIKTRAWDDREGNKRYTTEIVGDNMQLMGRKGDSGADPMPSQTAATDAAHSSSKPADDFIAESDGADDLPF